MTSSPHDSKFHAAYLETLPELREDFLEFMSLVVTGSEQIAPTEEIDSLLHLLLDDEVRDSVESAFSVTIVHNPGLRGNELNIAYDRFKQLQRDQFGAHQGGSAAMCGVTNEPALYSSGAGYPIDPHDAKSKLRGIITSIA